MFPGPGSSSCNNIFSGKPEEGVALGTESKPGKYHTPAVYQAPEEMLQLPW